MEKGAFFNAGLVIMEVKDYSQCTVLPRTYGGDRGRKLSIVDEHNDVWMLKFPRKAVDNDTGESQYVTGSVSEYIASHIYASIGIPTQETVVGMYNDKVVVACKDFTVGKRYDQFVPAENLLNTIDSKLLLGNAKLDNPSEYNTCLEDWLSVFTHSAVALANPALEERFWTHFVIDTFIGHSNRHGGNWSMFLVDGDKVELALVYGNSKSLCNNGNTPYSFEGKPLDAIQSIKEHAIGSLVAYPPLVEVIHRVVPKIDMESIYKIIDDVPNEINGVDIVSNERKVLLKRFLQLRYEDVLLPSLMER